MLLSTFNPNDLDVLNWINRKKIGWMGWTHVVYSNVEQKLTSAGVCEPLCFSTCALSSSSCLFPPFRSSLFPACQLWNSYITRFLILMWIITEIIIMIEMNKWMDKGKNKKDENRTQQKVNNWFKKSMLLWLLCHRQHWLVYLTINNEVMLSHQLTLELKVKRSVTVALIWYKELP